MRLLYIAPINFEDDMFSSAWISRAKALEAKGWQIAFVIPENSNNSIIRNNENFRIFNIKRSSIIGLQGISWERALRLGLGNIIEKYNPDVIISDWNGSSGVLQVAEKFGVPWVFDDHSPPADGGIIGNLQWYHYDKSWKKNSIYADGVVVLTPSQESLVRNRYGHEFPIIKCQSGVDLDLFNPLTRKTSLPIRMVYHGSLTPERGVLDLIKVTEALLSSRFDVILRVFGSGPCLPQFQKMAETSNNYEVFDKVQFQDVPKLLSDCHIGLLPWSSGTAFSTSSPIKLFEYAASGLTVVGTDVESNIPFADSEWFKVVDRGDPVNSIRKGIIELISEGRISSLGNSARLDAEKRFSWDMVTQELHLLLLNLRENDRNP
jgi:glycosyltransferase involved in cell wall biosynthesis